jgi:hypothetical protein
MARSSRIIQRCMIVTGSRRQWVLAIQSTLLFYKSKCAAQPNLQLSAATGKYDPCRPLLHAEVEIDGVTPVLMMLSPAKHG